MINNIKKSSFPNNIYLEINGVGWKHSDEILQLTPDHELGAIVVCELMNDKYAYDLLRERFINKKTYEEIGLDNYFSSTKVSKMINEMLDEIRENEKYKNMILKGYKYYKEKM